MAEKVPSSTRKKGPGRSGLAPVPGSPLSQGEPGSLAAEPAPPTIVSLKLPAVDYDTAFTAYEVYTGLKIIRDPSLATIRGHLDLRLERVSREEAIQALQNALRDQLNIVLERMPDGKVIGRRGPR